MMPSIRTFIDIVTEATMDGTPAAIACELFAQQIDKSKGLADVSPVAPNQIILTTLRAFNPREGFGRRAMNILCQICDQQNVTISLTADADAWYPGNHGHMNQWSLVHWYESLGFKKLPARDPIEDRMERLPMPHDPCISIAAAGRLSPGNDLA